MAVTVLVHVEGKIGGKKRNKMREREGKRGCITKTKHNNCSLRAHTDLHKKSTCTRTRRDYSDLWMYNI